ncbi:response regulator [Methylobacterium planeticum]|uniref:Response regulator n=1 Tax=Methylobacterium planeticum TaxID=2615211 RepID=A0A6N6MN59_9HYPH|nr:response regulator [Methylobacterium planeticum]KAB1072723.1 response regulator [Methylobacterium planeticum]
MSEADPGPIAILVVDLDRVIRMVTMDMLEEAGYRALEARDAREAVALLERHRDVRLLITGQTLPGQIDGIGLVHLVRSRWPKLGILVTSGALSRSGRELPAGARLVRKPYQFDDLLREVEGLIGPSAEAGEGARVLPETISVPMPSGQASGGATIAGPTPEPDKT